MAYYSWEFSIFLLSSYSLYCKENFEKKILFWVFFFLKIKKKKKKTDSANLKNKHF